jgi:hypothetical protein
MESASESVDKILEALVERAKELNCLYQIDEILGQPAASAGEVYQRVVQAIPPGWQFPNVCKARLDIDGEVYTTPGFEETAWSMCTPIEMEGQVAGSVSVYYIEERPTFDEGPFLREERRLVNAIAQRLGLFLLQRKLRDIHANITGALGAHEDEEQPWTVLLEVLRQTDRHLLQRINRKMINHLGWAGIRIAPCAGRRCRRATA